MQPQAASAFLHYGGLTLLAAPVFLGKTRRKGLRWRTVSKASEWLEGFGRDTLATQVLTLLATAERGDDLALHRGIYQDLLEQLRQADMQG